MVSDDDLHAEARRIVAERAAMGFRPKKKHLRYDEIVAAAQAFYPCDPFGGVQEMVDSCYPVSAGPEIGPRPNENHNPEVPMWLHLRDFYRWMIPDTAEYHAAMRQMLGQP